MWEILYTSVQNLKNHQREAAIKATQMDTHVQCTVLASRDPGYPPPPSPPPPPPSQLLALHQLPQLVMAGRCGIHVSQIWKLGWRYRRGI
jgi:hypothetical protein